MTGSDTDASVAGVDGCRGGWVTATVKASVREDGRIQHPVRLDRLRVLPHFADVLAETGRCRLVGVDMPIGLTDGPGPRSCDVEARRSLGKRASSVFTPPVRAALEAPDYSRASRIQFERTGKKLSRQGFFITPKIREVDRLMTVALQRRVREIHPELAFRELNGGRPTTYNKKSLAGRRERVALLARVFCAVERTVREYRRAGVVEPDDILDTLVAAWTALQAVTGQSFTLPGRPETDAEGLRMEIVCPKVAEADATGGKING
jgi:predicted RNase H-like nuclease